MNTIRNGFDYEHQAFVLNGKYVRCGHPEAMNCGCYGRLHEGEPATTQERGANDMNTIQSTDTRRPTPWGQADYQYQLAPGVSFVNTPGHGGFLIGFKAAEKYLTLAAINSAEPFGKFLAFEEDCLASIVVFEHPEWGTMLGMKVDPKELFESISYWTPNYLRLRGIEPDAETLKRKATRDAEGHLTWKAVR